ncbi:hypothetical protein GCM10027059_01870 [Myceligenerans halotolerans]
MHTTTNSRPRPALVAAVAVAVVSTLTAYLAMVAFGTDVLHMSPWLAYVCTGVFELSLVTVALLAREAARDNRPGGILLTLTWALSATSGVFAAWHELVADAPLAETLGAAAFRFLTPLLAALMWHLALIGDRHLATGASWSGMRATMRMHALFLATEDLYRVQADHTGTRAARRQLAAAARRRRRARAVALRSVAPADMRAHCAAHVDAVKAQADADAELAALHVAHRARLAAVLDGHAPTATPALVSVSGADTYADKAAAAIEAEVADMTAPAPALVSAATTRTQPRATTARVRGRKTRTTTPAPNGQAARRAIVSALLDANPSADSRDAIEALRAAGHQVTDRTARRDFATVRDTRHTDTTTDTTEDTTTDTTPAHAADTGTTTADTPALAEVN